MDGITYFRLVSQYDNDITKNCGLTGSEIDNNFYVLEGRDVKSVTLDGDTLKVNLYNGNVLTANMSGLTESITDAMGNFVQSLSFEFDRDNGILRITQNGQTQEIDGFVTTYEGMNFVATDETLVGTGKPSSPLGISPAYQTGFFKPVNSIVDKTEGQSLPTGENLHVGDRFLVHDKISEYGTLYNYEGVKRISCDLYLSNSPWRIPTKADWDDMMNAIEPNEADRDHTNTSSNRYLGKYAGGYLKSKTGWKGTTETPAPGGDGSASGTSVTDMLGNTTTGHCCCGHNVPACSPMYCGEYSTCCCRPSGGQGGDGTDMYGFNAKPAGYVDDGNLYGYFGERGSFWTATLSPSGNSAYIKRFEWDKTNVYQDIISTKYFLSLRLVKDFNGSNFYGKEQILGDIYDTVRMPSLSNGSKVWTAVNVAFANDSYCGVQPSAEGITLTDRYYIVEWNGSEWVSNAFSEGDSVVVLNAPDGDKSVTYMLIDGILTRLSDTIAEQVIDAVQSTIDQLNDAIEAEAQARQEADNALGERIDTLQSSLEQEVIDRTVADDELRDLINQEVAERIDADTELSNRIDDVAKKVHVQQSEDGTVESEFDPATGQLKLVTNDGETNTITVQFGFNFGDV